MKYLPTSIISFIGNIVIKFILITSKIKIHGEENLKEIYKKNLPMLMCVWHGRLLFPCIFCKQIKTTPWIIASNHRDGQIGGNIFKKWKFKIISGSTGKGGDQVTKKMKDIFNNSTNNWIGVTNDGPKGPAQVAKPGSINAAIKSQSKIVSITGSANKSWTFNTWDKLMIPKPFSTIYIYISKPIIINENNIIDQVTLYINKAQDEADKLI